jgi:uncharacterized protein with PIN domain
MLGGLARWLCAAGYDAEFDPRVDDGDLVSRAAASGQVALSSDGGIFDRTVVRTGVVHALYVPGAWTSSPNSASCCTPSTCRCAIRAA